MVVSPGSDSDGGGCSDDGYTPNDGRGGSGGVMAVVVMGSSNDGSSGSRAT